MNVCSTARPGFESAGGHNRLDYDRNGVNAQQLHGMRVLTAPSATQLEAVNDAPLRMARACRLSLFATWSVRPPAGSSPSRVRPPTSNFRPSMAGAGERSAIGGGRRWQV
jgi:hypothetical protein